MTGQLPLVLKVDDVAKELGVSRSAVYRRIASDDLPVFQWGGARHAIRISRVQFCLLYTSPSPRDS